MNDTAPVIDVRGLRKSFANVEVLKGIDFQVQRGKTVSILGSSGSGKSTMLRCINWLEQPDSGSIHIAGEPIGIRTDGKSAMSGRELARMRARTAMVFQSFNLWPHLTALENVIEAPIHVQGVARDEALTRARSLLDKVGMSHKVDAYPWTISGGHKQRVAISRALAMNTEVILF